VASARTSGRCHARSPAISEYAVTKGWIVADEYIYVDDGISGADGWTANQAFKEMMQYKFGADVLHPEFKEFVYSY